MLINGVERSEEWVLGWNAAHDELERLLTELAAELQEYRKAASKG